MDKFWTYLDDVVESIPNEERVVIGADFNGHVGEGNRGDENVMGRYGMATRREMQKGRWWWISRQEWKWLW